MKRKTMLKRRYLIFLIGLVLTAFGVAIVTKGVLGTSPIAAIPYSLSLVVPIFPWEHGSCYLMCCWLRFSGSFSEKKQTGLSCCCRL